MKVSDRNQNLMKESDVGSDLGEDDQHSSNHTPIFHQYMSGGLIQSINITHKAHHHYTENYWGLTPNTISMKKAKDEANELAPFSFQTNSLDRTTIHSFAIVHHTPTQSRLSDFNILSMSTVKSICNNLGTSTLDKGLCVCLDSDSFILNPHDFISEVVDQSRLYLSPKGNYIDTSPEKSSETNILLGIDGVDQGHMCPKDCVCDESALKGRNKGEVAIATSPREKYYFFLYRNKPMNHKGMILIQK